MKEKNSQNKRLVILDAHAIIHRAYHALPAFTNSRGESTGALYGITAMLIRIFEELKPDSIVAAYDLPKPTFRHLSYEGYKAGRAKADDTLVEQIIASRGIFDIFNVPMLDAEGFEADDIIGTLVEQYKDVSGVDIVIASGDMDTMQLVKDDKVQVYTLKRGVRDMILYNEEAVTERYGFSPEKLVDFKGLRGDPSDNIIGVKGVGDKTATNIIQKFGTIENLYEAIDKEDEKSIKEAGISPRILGILKESRDEAFFSKTLATIRRDAPIVFDIKDGEYQKGLNENEILDLMSRYEFTSLVPRIKKVFSFKEEVVQVDVDPKLLREASIALWVLYSEQANPTLDMILQRTRKKTLNDAYDVLIDELKKENLIDIFEKIEKPLIPIIEEMSNVGIKIDQNYYADLARKMSEELSLIEKKIKSFSKEDFNLNSPKQLSKLIFDDLGLKPKGKRKASGAYTTSADVLEGLVDDHEIIPLILSYREVQKLLSTYVTPFIEHAKKDGRIHATFLQHGTSTGRFSSTNPNVQNIPNSSGGKFGGDDIRKGIIADEGKVFISSDYSQIELRMLAILSGEEKLIESFKKGDDIHSTVASFMFDTKIEDVTHDMRRAAKVVNFGILFGMGVSALQKNLNTTREEAQKFYNEYFENFPKVTSFLELSKEKAKIDGYTTTLFGRKRYFPGIKSSAGFLRAIAERMASNAPIQGSAADIIKIAIKLIDEDLKKTKLDQRASLVLQIHDELVYEVEKDSVKEVQNIIESAMSSVFERSSIKYEGEIVPLSVSTSTGERLDLLK